MDVACKVCDGYCQGSCTARVSTPITLCRQCGRAYDARIVHKCPKAVN